MSVKGGKKLLRKLAQLKRETRQLERTSAEVGFPRDVARQAAQHEFGMPSQNLPERPAFRQALPEVLRVFSKTTLRARQSGHLPAPAAVRKGAEAAAAELRRQYQMGERLAPVSERTAERKAGTPGEGKPLVGTRGPRMISRVRAWVNGVEIGGGS